MTQPDFWAIPEAKLAALRAEREGVVSALNYARQELGELEQRLRPSDREVIRFKALLAQTYDCVFVGEPPETYDRKTGEIYPVPYDTSSGRLMPNVAGRGARKPLWAALRNLDREFGNARTDRSRARASVRALLINITRINKLLASAEKRKTRKPRTPRDP
jgi:hypothetical protein